MTGNNSDGAVGDIHSVQTLLALHNTMCLVDIHGVELHKQHISLSLVSQIILYCDVSIYTIYMCDTSRSTGTKTCYEQETEGESLKSWSSTRQGTSRG